MSTSVDDSSVNSTETGYRYAAYANRIRTILLSAHRYVAYTSDIGESFRPIAHPWLVRSAYTISWTYLLGDVGHEGYKAYLRNWKALAPTGEAYKDASQPSQNQIIKGMATGNITIGNKAESKGGISDWPTAEIPLAEDYRMVMAKRAVFQSIASMGLPAFTIHSVVRYSGQMVKGVKIAFIRTWTPIGVCPVSFRLKNINRRMANTMLTHVSYSLVLPLSPSFPTFSIILSTRPLNGPSALVFVLTAAKQPSAHCQARASLPGKRRKFVLLRRLIYPGTSTRLSGNERVSSVGSQVSRSAVVELHR